MKTKNTKVKKKETPRDIFEPGRKCRNCGEEYKHPKNPHFGDGFYDLPLGNSHRWDDNGYIEDEHTDIVSCIRYLKSIIPQITISKGYK